MVSLGILSGNIQGAYLSSFFLNRLEGSHMWKHCIQKHNGEEQQFTMHIDRTFRRDPLLRQITEAIEINDTDEEKRMNSRAEWHQPRVPRINIEI